MVHWGPSKVTGFDTPLQAYWCSWSGLWLEGKKKAAKIAALKHLLKKNIFKSDFFYVNGIGSLLPLLQFKLDPVISLDLVNQPADVHKCFRFGIVMSNETITFFLVEKLYGSLDFVVHCKKYLY